MDQLLRWALVTCLFSLLASAAVAATLGTVVPISGHAADIALDEARGVVYVANYTANRIDIVSTKTRLLQTSLSVAAQPASLALSPDGQYLVVTHVSNFASPAGTPNNALTVIALNGNKKQTFSFGTPPLGVAFGNDGLALIATTTDFLLFDPATGYSVSLGKITASTKALPVDIGQYPRDIIRASVTASGDGTRIFGALEYGNSADQIIKFRYDVGTMQVDSEYWIWSPPAGPRVVSTDRTGSAYITGWALFHPDGYELAQFPNAQGDFSIGSHAIDGGRRTVYAQISLSAAFQIWPATVSYAGPVLMVADSDNLTVREQLKLAENLSGRSVLTSDGNIMYSVSDSGLTILPVGQLAQNHRVTASVESVAFRGNWCDRTIQSQEITITDPGGGTTDFALSTSMAGISFSPSSGTTPAKVKVLIDPNAFQNTKGTESGLILIQSAQAVNVPVPVRVLVNNREPDQRGTFLDIPGKLVDVLADPVRNRFYVLRQDKNQVLVFDASTYKQIATLRTGNTAWSMAMTFDKKYLLTGADNSQVAHLFDLDTLQFVKYIVMPGGHCPRSIAVSGRAILVASRGMGKNAIHRIQMWGVATEYPSVGVFKNDINADTALSASPSGSFILVAMADGRTLLYDANADSFVAARKDFTALQGAFAALSDDRFVVDNHILNGSLVRVQDLETGSGDSSGFSVIDNLGLRTTAPKPVTAGSVPDSPGIIQRVDISAFIAARPTRMSEAPVLPQTSITTAAEQCDVLFGQTLCKPAQTTTTVLGSVFTRSLAPLANRNAIISLSTSGFIILPWLYDAAVADPKINSVVNAADGKAGVAPGGLISILGTDLNPINIATNQIPLPTALGDSCLTVNGVLVPMILVSPTRINGQLPVDVSGAGTMVLHTPAGVSNLYRFPILPTAPAIFRTDIQGWDALTPTVVRGSNNLLVTPSNPIHLSDDEPWIVIYSTGLGLTDPGVASGYPGLSDPLSNALVLPEVTLGGTSLSVSFAGLVPGQVGQYQINAQIPFKGVPTGMEVPLTITQGDSTTTVNVRVVN